MVFVKEVYSTQIEIKQSKFIAYLMPYSLFTQTLQKLQTEHPKARHFVTAYRYLNEYNQIVENSSDDGEPKGTSGKPALFVLQGATLVNSAVVIVRYFGGTKLGTGGLVRAYSDSVNQTIESAVLYEYQKKIVQEIRFEYTNVRMIEYEAEVFSVDILEKRFTEQASYKLEAKEEDMKHFLKKIERIIVKEL